MNFGRDDADEAIGDGQLDAREQIRHGARQFDQQGGGCGAHVVTAARASSTRGMRSKPLSVAMIIATTPNRKPIAHDGAASQTEQHDEQRIESKERQCVSSWRGRDRWPHAAAKAVNQSRRWQNRRSPTAPARSRHCQASAAMSAVALPEASSFARRSAMSDGANSTRGLIAPVRHNSSSAAMKPPTTSRRIKADPAHDGFPCRIVFSDSSRSTDHSRAVIAPKAGSAATRESRSRGQPVSSSSMIRPGRADIRPIRSDGIAASSRACVINSTVAPVVRQHLQQFVTHDQPRLRVERAKGLVEQDHARLHHQRPRDADPLAHAARKLRQIGLGKIDQTHQPQRVVEPARDLRCLDAVAAQAEHDVVGDVEPRQTTHPPETRRRRPRARGHRAGDLRTTPLRWSVATGRRARRAASTSRSRTGRSPE